MRIIKLLPFVKNLFLGNILDNNKKNHQSSLRIFTIFVIFLASHLFFTTNASAIGNKAEIVRSADFNKKKRKFFIFGGVREFNATDEDHWRIVSKIRQVLIKKGNQPAESAESADMLIMVFYGFGPIKHKIKRSIPLSGRSFNLFGVIWYGWRPIKRRDETTNLIMSAHDAKLYLKKKQVKELWELKIQRVEHYDRSTFVFDRMIEEAEKIL